LYADKSLTEYWHQELTHDTNFKVGLCWQGNANYSTQSLREAVKTKSLHVGMFEPLSRIPGVSLYSLQKVSGEDQLSNIDFSVHTFDGDFDNSHGRFMDTAAVMKNLDLIITVDTSTAHIAGGLGVSTWVLLPYLADWRWLLDRTDSPWYPSMRLFNQPEKNGWESVIQDMVTALNTLLKKDNNDA